MDTAAGLRLVHANASGWLFVAPDERWSDAPVYDANGIRPVVLRDREARFIHCAAAADRPLGSGPGTGCLADLQQFVAGSAAYTGSGRVDGILLADAAGAVSCPGSLSLHGAIAAPSGEAFELTGSLALLSSAASPTGCVSAGESAWLTPLIGPARGLERDAARELASLDAALASVRAQLSGGASVDDQTWSHVRELLGLTDEEWLVLAAVLQQNPPASAGLLTSARATPSPQMLVNTPAPEDAEGLLQDILDKVKSVQTNVQTVRSKVDQVFTNVQSALNRMPDREDVRDFLSQVDLGRLRDIADDVREGISGVVDLIRELRDGFEAFAPARSCAGSTPCAAFRAQLITLLRDIETAWSDVQEIGCLLRPKFEPVPLDTRLARRLVEMAPPLLLYAAHQGLEHVPGWDQLAAKISAELPPELFGHCENEIFARFNRETASPAERERHAEAFESFRCGRLGSENVEVGLDAVKVIANLVKFVAECVEAWAPDDKIIAAGATAVAGATFGTNVKNPLAGTAETVKILAEGAAKMFERLLDKRKDCLDARDQKAAVESQIEASLAFCASIADFSIPEDSGGRWEDVFRLVEARIQKFRELGRPTGEAFTLLQKARDAGASWDSYRTLCDAYQELRKASLAGTAADAPGTARDRRDRGGL